MGISLNRGCVCAVSNEWLRISAAQGRIGRLFDVINKKSRRSSFFSIAKFFFALLKNSIVGTYSVLCMGLQVFV